MIDETVTGDLMGVIDGRTMLERLGNHECWELLRSRQTGRIGLLTGTHPEIFPINYAVMDRRIVFRTAAGTKLRALENHAAVCFEIDHSDVESRTGWSVLVKGQAAELSRDEDLRRAAELPLDLWLVGHKNHWFAIRPSEVTGRRIAQPAGPSAGTPTQP
ncbi:MAG: pyridoxamine 5'-phosphate oxidase family protein [Microthrixaceae bacterium]|nr:pyridoxamine 5'-phosphate oxidase family protein [Microthrixaceae bacterium]